MDIENFLDSHSYARTTKERYARILTTASAEPIAQWSASDLLRYVQGRGWGEAMQSLALHTLKKYIRWKFGGSHPALTARMKPPVSPPQIVLSKTQAEKLLAHFDPHTEKGARDLALACLALDTGLRASELANVELKYMDLDERVLKVIVKRGQWGTAVWSAATANVLNKWLAYHDGKSPRLFYSLHHVKRGQPLNRDGIRQIVKQWGRELGFHITPHSLRRSFATLATVLGAPTRVVQVAGRWTKIETVEKYTREIEQKAMEKYFPAEALIRV